LTKCGGSGLEIESPGDCLHDGLISKDIVIRNVKPIEAILLSIYEYFPDGVNDWFIFPRLHVLLNQPQARSYFQRFRRYQPEISGNKIFCEFIQNLLINCLTLLASSHSSRIDSNKREFGDICLALCQCFQNPIKPFIIVVKFTKKILFNQNRSEVSTTRSKNSGLT